MDVDSRDSDQELVIHAPLDEFSLSGKSTGIEATALSFVLTEERRRVETESFPLSKGASTSRKKYRDRSPMSRREKERESRSRSSRERLSGETRKSKEDRGDRRSRRDEREIDAERSSRDRSPLRSREHHRHHHSDRDLRRHRKEDTDSSRSSRRHRSPHHHHERRRDDRHTDRVVKEDDRRDHKRSHNLSSERYVTRKVSNSSDDSDSDVPLKSSVGQVYQDGKGIDSLLRDLPSGSSGILTTSDSDSESEKNKRDSQASSSSRQNQSQQTNSDSARSSVHEEGELKEEVSATLAEEVLRRGRWYSGYDEDDLDTSKSKSPGEAEREDRPSVFHDSEDEQSEMEDQEDEEVPQEVVQEQAEEEEEVKEPERTPSPELPVYYPATMGCRNVENYEWLNRIEEGTYGVVYRAKDKRTGT